MDVTRADLDAQTITIKAHVDLKIDPVRERVDRINGSIVRHERELADHAAQLRELRGNMLTTEDLAGVEDSAPAETITKRDLKIVIWTIVGIGTAVAGWQELVQWLIALGKAATK